MEIKAQTMRVLINVLNRLKFGKISRRDVLCTPMWNNGYWEFDHRGTLKKDDAAYLNILVHKMGKVANLTLIALRFV